jgi:hypothetical protein
MLDQMLLTTEGGINMAKNEEVIRCRFVKDAGEKPTVHYGFGTVYHYNGGAELYTIIDDGGNVIQKGDGLVSFPENKVN